MKLRPRDRLALIGIGLVVALAAFYLLVLKPEQHKASSLSAQIATARQTLVSAQSNYAAGRAAAASLSKDRTQWTELGLAVPQQSDIPALLRLLERNAKAVGVSMQAITLSNSATTTPSSSSSTLSTTPGSAAPAASGIPVQLTFQGGYDALNTLVRRLNGLVVVSGDKVTATGPLLSISGVSLTGSKSLTVQLTAMIYQLDAPGATASTTGG
jgi:Tfp pilus assembly protein PilO